MFMNLIKQYYPTLYNIPLYIGNALAFVSIFLLGSENAIGQVNLINNGSFECYTICPNGTSGQVDRAIGWFQGIESGNYANTSDYFNCGWTFSLFTAPQPYPDGSGIMGFYTNIGGFSPSNINTREYIGTFANIEAGEDYTFEFYAVKSNNSSTNYMENDICIFVGNTTSLPLPANFNNCPDGFIQIACIPVNTLTLLWKPFTLQFTSPGSYNSIVIGAECTPTASQSFGDRGYAFVDGLNLYVTEVDTINTCIGNSVSYEISNLTFADTYNWTMPSSWVVQSGGTSSDNSITFDPNGIAGELCVAIQDSCASDSMFQCVFISIETTFVNVNLGNDTVLCQGDVITLDVTMANATYLWQDNSTNSIFNITQSGVYWVQVTNVCGMASDAINVAYYSIPTVNLGNDTTLCQGATLTLDATFPNSIYQWQDSSMNSTYIISQGGTYWVESSNICGLASDTINISYNPLPVANLTNDTSLCQGDSLKLDVSFSNASYLWQDNSTKPCLSVVQAGVYWVEVSNTCGSIADTIYISYIQLPMVDLNNKTSLCQGASLTLDATNINATYLWQDNSTNPTFEISEEGFYWVEVISTCGTVSDTVLIDMSDCKCYLCVPDAFTPDGFGIDVNNKLYVFSKLEYKDDALESINFKIFNRWGEVVFKATESSQIIYPDGGWDGTHMKSGKNMEVGVYVWLLTAQTIKGESIGPISGNITLLR